MKRFGSQLHKKAQSIRLSATERADLRERIVSYMEYHPLPKGAAPKPAVEALVTEPYRAIKINYTYVSSFVGVFTMLLLVIVPLVAEQAVPGDALYPVKVQFNEELRSTLTLSPYDKIEWETKRLERRLAEARLLADEGKLTEDIEAEVAEAVQAHSEAAKQGIATIRESDNDEAVMAEIALSSALEVQSEVLESREGQANEAGRSVAILAGVVAQARDGVEASHEHADLSFEKLAARIEIETTSAHELFSSIREGASEEEVTNIERRFADIKRKIDEASAQYATTADDEVATSDEGVKSAKTLLKVALSDTRKLISFMTDIDVRTSVSIEELVPVELTTEEKALAAVQAIEDLQAAATALQDAIPKEDIAEKYAVGYARLNEMVENALTAYAANDFKRALELTTEGQLIVADLFNMVTIDVESGSEVDAPTNQQESAKATTSNATSSPADVSDDAPVEEVAGTSTEETVG